MTATSEARSLRVLVLTNHFSNFAGSELVALHTAQWFAARGDAVTIGANSAGAPIMKYAEGIDVTTDIAALKLSAFDLVWCQHDLLSLLPIEQFCEASASAVPHVAYASLSPFEPYEHFDAGLARALSAEIFANSPETAAEIIARNRGVVAPSQVRVFYNAAPEAFWRTPTAPSAEALGSLLIISNHVPPELLEAVALLQARGIKTRLMGLHREFDLVGPDEIAAADAVVTIGKSVVYAIAQQKPVYIYDHFGGDGWLTRASYALNAENNFSGRPNRRKLNARALVAEITEGYADAVREASLLGEVANFDDLKLDNHLAPLRERALARNLSWRCGKLAYWLKQPGFRAYLSTLRSKSEVMRRLHLILETGVAPD